MIRGNSPESEVEHSRLLLEGGAETIWGWNTPAGQERVRARVEWIKASCRLSPGMRVMECGCGTGMFTSKIALVGCDLVGTDISQALLDRAREKCTQGTVDFCCTNLESPDNIPDSSFDAMYGVSVLHHLNLDAALPSLFDKLKPGGRFAFSEPNLANPINKYIVFTKNLDKRKALGVSPSEMAFHKHELEKEFRKHRFHVDSIKYKDFMHPSIPGLFIVPFKVLQAIAESIPLVRRLSGSIWIEGTRPNNSKH